MKKEYNHEKECARIRREQEIAEHGKQISLRRGGEHKSPKDYSRKGKKIRLTDITGE